MCQQAHTLHMQVSRRVVSSTAAAPSVTSRHDSECILSSQEPRQRCLLASHCTWMMLLSATAPTNCSTGRTRRKQTNTALTTLLLPLMTPYLSPKPAPTHLAAVACCGGAVLLEHRPQPRQTRCSGAWPDAVISSNGDLLLAVALRVLHLGGYWHDFGLELACGLRCGGLAVAGCCKLVLRLPAKEDRGTYVRMQLWSWCECIGAEGACKSARSLKRTCHTQAAPKPMLQNAPAHKVSKHAAN